MIFRQLAIVAFLSGAVSGFVSTQPTFQRGNVLKSIVEEDFSVFPELLNYEPGKADTELARRFGHLAGKPIKTAGETFATFTEKLGVSVNALYKNAITDLVGTTHLVVVNARFQKDPIWSAGMCTALDLILKNYPEPEIAAKIESSLFEAVEIDQAEVRAEAQMVKEWAAGKTKEEAEAALMGQGDSAIAGITNAIRDEQYWMYSRYFGLGLLTIMEQVGVEMDKDVVYRCMEDWMKNKLGKPPYTACDDGELFFKVKSRFELMETMMKEIEIREKKRMAARLEAKAELALQAAEGAADAGEKSSE